MTQQERGQFLFQWIMVPYGGAERKRFLMVIRHISFDCPHRKGGQMFSSKSIMDKNGHFEIMRDRAKRKYIDYPNIIAVVRYTKYMLHLIRAFSDNIETRVIYLVASKKMQVNSVLENRLLFFSFQVRRSNFLKIQHIASPIIRILKNE